MRLAICMHRACTSIERLPDYDGPPEAAEHYDVILSDWVSRHLHGERGDETPNERHPGGRIVTVDTSGATDQEAEDAILNATMSEIAKELQLISDQVFDYRDELRESAAKCYVRHGGPNAIEGDRCGSYRSKGKLVGRGDKAPPAYRKFLCDFCAYQTTVQVELRRRAGVYR